MSHHRVLTGRARPLCEGRGCRKTDAEPDRRSVAIPGLRLCRGCRERLVARLEELPHLHEACGRVLSAGNSQGPREIRAGSPSQGLPFNGAAADVRAEIMAFLSSWCGLVAQGRGTTAPERAVWALAAFLRRHADWLAAHPAAAEAADEIARLTGRARRVAYPDQIRRLKVGACVEAGCDGELVAWIRAQETTAPGKIQCEAEPRHCWTGQQWAQLRRAMRRTSRTPADDTECWLTAADISRLWDAPTGTVYRLASQQGWRRRSRAGRTYYAESDVRSSFSRRAGAR
jgi:hypothetical protein